MAKKEKKIRTIAEILVSRKDELLKDWLHSIHSLAGTRTMELMTAEQLRVQATDLLATLTKAFGAEQYVNIDAPEFADSVALLQDISASRAKQGFTPSETAFFIFSLGTSIREILIKELEDDLPRMREVISNVVNVMEKLSLISFETYVKTREEVISQQSRSLMELTTPVMRVWEEIIMLPIVGVIDTPRAAQLMESLLEAVVRTESRVAILDVTGVPVIDTKVAQHLVKTSAAAKMLGAEVIITGISAAAAQTLTKLDVDITAVRTRGSLRAGLSEALNMVGLQVSEKQ